MTEYGPTLDLNDRIAGFSGINSQVIEAAPAVALASNLLAVTSALSRATLDAANQSQCNGIVAMAQAARLCREAAGGDIGMTLKEAIDLLKQVAATAPDR
jgi:hypothetical protein